MRLSFDGGKSYPQKHERNLSPGLPTVPAAVRIFGKDGTCAAIFLDFDSSVAGKDWVEADVRSVQDWLHRRGARWIEDYSPNGGRHIYIPLSRRVTFTEARDLVEALGNRLRTLDKTPHQNLLHGCMRTPGSPHKIRGHYQQLAMSLAMAYDVARRPNSADVWQGMTSDLASEIEAVRAYRLEQSYSPAPEASTGPALVDAHGRMSRTMQRIAASGLYETNRYASDSEARQGVITGAAAAGLTLVDVDRRMKQGAWPGLASFYARYPARHRMPALRRDWDKAVRYLRKNNGQPAGKNNARKYPTSQPNTQRGLLHGGNSGVESVQQEHRFIRTWRNALRITETRYRESRGGMGRRMVLRALGEAAHKTGSRFVEFGGRSLAVASGMDHTTVVAHLRALRKEDSPMIELIREGRGRHGDQYMLSIPEEIQDGIDDIAWRGGKLHAMRPAFRELGMPAAFVYEALEAATTPLMTADIVRITGLSRTAVSEALEILAAWNLAERGTGWSAVRSTSLLALAERLGVLDAVAEQVHRYKVERARWHEWLLHHAVVIPFAPSPGDDYPWERYSGPPDDMTLADLAFREAG